MAAIAQYASTPRGALAQVSQANTGMDGSGSLGTTLINVMQGGINGTRIDDIYIVSAGSIAADTMVRLFLYDGANSRLWDEILISATGTVGQNTRNFSTKLENLGLILPTNSWYLRATIHTANIVNVLVTRAGDF